MFWAQKKGSQQLPSSQIIGIFLLNLGRTLSWTVWSTFPIWPKIGPPNSASEGCIPHIHQNGINSINSPKKAYRKERINPYYRLFLKTYLEFKKATLLGQYN